MKVSTVRIEWKIIDNVCRPTLLIDREPYPFCVEITLVNDKWKLTSNDRRYIETDIGEYLDNEMKWRLNDLNGDCHYSTALSYYYDGNVICSAEFVDLQLDGEERIKLDA